MLELWKWSPLFRSPQQIAAMREFLIDDPMKEHILSELATGFISHFEYTAPHPWGTVSNYPPLQTAQGREKFRAAMNAQIIAGKMIGGIG